MSDSFQTIVDVQVGAGEAAALADRLRGWLLGKGIIDSALSNNTLDQPGHRPGPQAASVQEMRVDLSRVAVNGVQILVGRRVFDAGGNGAELTCERCLETFSPDSSWTDAVGAWHSGADSAGFACPRCGEERPLIRWRGPFPWGFGPLGLCFWNWPPLSPDFVEAVAAQLDHEVVLVRGRV